MDGEMKRNGDVVRRLDILIALMLDPGPADSGVTMTDKISKLVALGVTPAEIARILGKPINYVTGAIHSRRKTKKGIA